MFMIDCKKCIWWYWLLLFMLLGGCGGAGESTQNSGQTTGQTVTNAPPQPTVRALPDLVTYTFAANSIATLPGLSTEFVAGAINCTGTLDAQDQIGDLALIAHFYQNGCWTNGQYNHADYQVEFGSALDSNGIAQYPAYRIHPPATLASQFLGSRHFIHYRFPSQEDYRIYALEDGMVRPLATVAVAAIDTTQYVDIGLPSPSDLTAPLTILIAPASQRVSNYSALKSGIEGARVHTGAIADVLSFRYTVAEQLHDTVMDYPDGPGTHANVYSNRRNFFLVQRADGLVGTLRQVPATAEIRLNWFDTQLPATTGYLLPNSGGELLLAATSDNSGTIYYLTVQGGNGAGTEIARSAHLYKVSASGNLLRVSALDTGPGGLNAVTVIGPSGNPYPSVLRYHNGRLALMFARTMHRTSDGLNHQGGIALLYDADTLGQLAHLGQTSGHSFENLLAPSGTDAFLGVDLGDNYPRGINLHHLSTTGIQSRVGYTFKTLHGTTAQSSAGITYPAYSQISSTVATFYQWSNDNRTYTELGGAVEDSAGITLVFAGERAPAGGSLDNARTGGNLNDPRNIGVLQLRSDFYNSSTSGCQVADDMVLSNGSSESGGFYNFGGVWTAQRNTGVRWLTSYSNAGLENATHLKAVGLPGGQLLLLWEVWTASAYVDTRMMRIDRQGNILDAPISLGNRVRLERRDDPLAIGNQVFLARGDATAKTIELLVIKLP